ncbi:MAG: formate--tetrahydrofolate ligase [Myxococcales bacterium FL481]|nr:MAG: formate--tetrahydrofolate ligase [Myxococcales bacterium FL481]
MPRPLSPLPPDAEIAQNTSLRPIEEIAAQLGLQDQDLEPYGRYKAKIRLEAGDGRKPPSGESKLILVTALTATSAGDGKTVTSIGLAQGLAHLGKSHCLCLRQPSLGPTFGIKGGAAGGGHAQVLPMEDINMHLTGDFHAITSANNLLSAVVDNHIYFDNEFDLDPAKLTWRRVLDLCDRQLRNCEIGLGGPSSGFPHPSGFDITAASEIMAVMALAKDREDLRARLGRMVVGYDRQGKPRRAEEFGCIGALEVLLKDALLPNLVQTTDHTPALLHCGPFANIAHGCNSLIATSLGTQIADYVVSEAGFAADLGAEKFLHIKCRELGYMPAAVVLVVTCRALKLHGGADAKDLKSENVEAVERGFDNPRVHIENLRKFGLPVVVAINRFDHDTDAELAAVARLCEQAGARHALSEVAHHGGEGGAALAQAVIEASAEGNRPYKPLYELSTPLRQKIETIAHEMYRADGVDFEPEAEAQLQQLENHGFGNLPVCMAKTQKSLSDDAKKLGAPTGWRLRVRSLKASAGAGFVVAMTGKMLLMPGMPRVGAAQNIGLQPDGRVVGLS